MSNTPMSREECARRRYQARYKIREILDAHDLSMREIGRRIGVSGEAVSATVKGRMHSAKVLEALRDVGVPERYLFDPRTARAASA